MATRLRTDGDNEPEKSSTLENEDWSHLELCPSPRPTGFLEGKRRWRLPESQWRLDPGSFHWSVCGC